MKRVILAGLGLIVSGLIVIAEEITLAQIDEAFHDYELAMKEAVSVLVLCSPLIRVELQKSISQMPEAKKVMAENQTQDQENKELEIYEQHYRELIFANNLNRSAVDRVDISLSIISSIKTALNDLPNSYVDVAVKDRVFMTLVSKTLDAKYTNIFVSQTMICLTGDQQSMIISQLSKNCYGLSQFIFQSGSTEVVAVGSNDATQTMLLGKINLLFDQVREFLQLK